MLGPTTAYGTVEHTIMLVPVLAGVLCLYAALQSYRRVMREGTGTERMVEIATAIQDGARAFIRNEYLILAAFVAAGAALLSIDASSSSKAAAFVAGAACSMLAGALGMTAATRANVRVANAAQLGIGPALTVAFRGGSVTGLLVSGLGLLGLGIANLVLWRNLAASGAAAWDRDVVGQVLLPLAGFALGASSMALFARVGGGIYTKAADVGADLVGIAAMGIPEDDPRNPAVIADNVGDNVGDVAGMGADLFESFVGSIVAAMVLGVMTWGFAGAALPLVVASLGACGSLLSLRFVQTDDEERVRAAMNRGQLFAGAVVLVGSLVACFLALDGASPVPGSTVPSGWLHVWGCVALGLVAGALIGLVTELATCCSSGGVRQIVEATTTGAATTIIQGLAVGMKSTALPALGIATVVVLAFHWGGFFGIALASVGMLSTAGMTVSVAAYGPIADNAGGIAEMAHMGPNIRRITDRLNAVGTATESIGKGFSIASAALTALAIAAAYAQAVDLPGLNLLRPAVIAGLLLGAVLPYFFSALTLRAVSTTAGQMIQEVTRQFRDTPAILEDKARPDYARCVRISALAAVSRMIVPGVLAVAAPLAVGFVDREALVGLLVGALVSGVLMALFMTTAGSAFESAKLCVEAGDCGGKNSPAHKCAVVGDTVGDPFKDAAGPAINIFVKLIAIVALVCATLFRN